MAKPSNSAANRPWFWYSLLAAVVAVCTHFYVYQCPEVAPIRDKVVLITGASSGIGAELALQYGAKGARIAIAARRAAQLEATEARALEAGAQDVLIVPTDMSDASACDALVQKTIERFGRLDILFLNHATVDDGLFIASNGTQSIDDTVLWTLRANLMGSAYAAKAALPYLEATGGHIAVVGSASAKVPAPFHIGYVTSKNALEGFFNTLRAELHLLNSRVTIGIQVLGMIATPEVTKDPALKGLAAPVPATAAEMICAAQARWYETYIPKWYRPWTYVT